MLFSSQKIRAARNMNTTEKDNTWLNADANKCDKMFLNKESSTDGIGHCIEAWIAFFGKQHLGHKSFKLCTAFAKDPKYFIDEYYILLLLIIIISLFFF